MSVVNSVGSKSDRARPLLPVSLLWWLAILVALINVLFILRRIPILRTEAGQGDAQAVEAAAGWIEQTPATARLLLLRSHRDREHRDVGAVWFAYRLNYLITPRQYEIAWDQLPPDSRQRYDLVLAFGSASSTVPTGWRVIHQQANVALLAPAEAAGPILTVRAPGREFGVKARPALLTRLGGILGLIAVVLLGALLMGWTSPRPPFQHWWANLAVAHLIGAASVTWIVTLTALLTAKLSVYPVYFTILILLPGSRRAYSRIFVSRERGKGAPKPVTVTLPARESDLYDLIRNRTASYLAMLLIALGLTACLERAWMLGIGWDGYSIWQLKAKAFVLDGGIGVLRDPLYAYYAHFDYPLLVPLQTWWVSLHAGGYSEKWAQLVGLIFTLDLLILFIAFARERVSTGMALLGAAILISLPQLTTHSVSGFADVEMACYLLAMSGMIAQMLASGKNDRLPVLAWIFAGVVAVKNEGALAAVAGLIVLLVLPILPILSRLRWKDQSTEETPDGERRTSNAISDRAKRVGWTAAGVCALASALSYLPWLLIKTRLHLTNDLFRSETHPHFTVSLVSWRLGTTIKGMFLTLTRIGPRYPCWGLFVLLLPVGLLMSRLKVRKLIASRSPACAASSAPTHQSGAASSASTQMWEPMSLPALRRVDVGDPLWAICAIQAIGYAGIYLITPWPLLAHLNSSVDRLWLHLAPTLLLAALIGCFSISSGDFDAQIGEGETTLSSDA